MECHRTGTNAGRGARLKGCDFMRLFWNCAGTVLLRRWPAMLLLSALSAKDFAEAIVRYLCVECWQRKDNLVVVFEKTRRLGDVANADVRHRASSSARVVLRRERALGGLDSICQRSMP
jgi:hypothetical protein